LDLDRYRAQADDFMTELMREHYLHFSGQKAEFEIEPIYERHAELYSRAAVDELRVSAETDRARVSAETDRARWTTGRPRRDLVLLAWP
jgi:hypothetical protein